MDQRKAGPRRKLPRERALSCTCNTGDDERDSSWRDVSIDCRTPASHRSSMAVPERLPRRRQSISRLPNEYFAESPAMSPAAG